MAEAVTHAAKRSARAPAKPARADGRSLADFDQLSPAEQALLDCCRRGEVAVIATECPSQETQANSVRASFVRFLALGGDEKAPVHERGVQLQGAWLTGVLDFEAAKVVHRLPLWLCRIERIDARNSSFKFLNLSGCWLVDGLNGDGLVCEGGVFLRDGFRATGEVRLISATVGELDCRGSSFEGSDYSLSCENAKILRGLFFREVKRIDGRVLMSSANVGTLCDDSESWALASGLLALDGFTYQRLVGPAPTDAAARIAWLEKQWPAHLGKDFRPQPWEQLIAVLRAMGHPDQARAVAIAKQEQLRRGGRLRRSMRPFHWLYGALVGYGYRPMRLVSVTAMVWLLCALAYWAATNPTVFGAETYLLAPPASERSAAAPAPDYGNFVPLIYSVDVLLPVIDLGYKNEWQPVVADGTGHPLIWGQLLRFLYWFEIAFGWVAGLLLVGVLGNLIKKD